MLDERLGAPPSPLKSTSCLPLNQCQPTEFFLPDFSLAAAKLAPAMAV